MLSSLDYTLWSHAVAQRPPAGGWRSSSRRRLPSARALAASLTATLLALIALAGVSVAPALAGEPATVTVRVEGLNETKLPATTVTTTAAPVVGDGDGQHACPGTSALDALQLATQGDWSGPWNAEFNQYEIYSIEGETHVFESGASANYYWSLWLDERESTVGACEAELKPGDRVLFFPSCYGEACPPAPTPLGIEAPADTGVGEAVQIIVKRYSSSGEATPAAGATISAGALSTVTDAAGHAQLSFTSAGQYTLRASAGPEAVRTEALVCVHAGEDGSCGTAGPAGAPGTKVSGGPAPAGPAYTGPYAIVADIAGIGQGRRFTPRNAPRLLSGNVVAHAPVTSISLRLRRTYRGRCWAYNDARERLVRVRCRQGSFFSVASGGNSFSYLLPARLPAGRYVIDVRAADAAGNHSALAAGSSRIVFYVG